jgi:hypothetical protein
VVAYPSLNTRYMTARTPGRRSGSSSGGGTRYGIAASRILPFARTILFAIAGSATRKARAISGVVRPPRVFRVRATRASIWRAGWQQVKISRSRSSGIPLTSVSSPPSPSSSASLARVSVFSRRFRSRRSRSMARLRAVAVIHDAGLAGTPRAGQVRSAWRNASCTASSARSNPPRMRTRVATARPWSCRNRRSTTSRASVATTAAPRTSGSVGSPLILPGRGSASWTSPRSPGPGSRIRAGSTRRAALSSP